VEELQYPNYIISRHHADMDEKTNLKKLTVTITGMTCTTCARTVEKAISRLPEVEYVSVNLTTNTAFIILREPTDLEKIKKAVEDSGYGLSTNSPEEEESKRHRETRKSFLIAISLTLPLTILMILHMLGIHIPGFPYIEGFIGSLVIFIAGRRTLKGAFIAISHKHANMDTLISIGAIASLLTAFLHLAGLEIESFGTIASMIITLHLLGRYIESGLRDKAKKEIRKILSLRPKEARVLINDKEVLLPMEAIKRGMVLLVSPGERVPQDGIILEGESSIDESMITGEPFPTVKRPGEKVIGGTINLTGLIKIQVNKDPEESFINQMVKLLQEVQGTRVPIQKIADRITNYFVPIIVFLAILSFLFWYLFYQKLTPYAENVIKVLPWTLKTESRLSFALFAFISTIVIACPCALGLAIPMALLSGTTLAAKAGVLIKNAEVIQTILECKYAVFDKTGTLTEGKPRVIEYNVPHEELDKIIYLESFSSHPLANAIKSIRNVENPPELQELKEIPGQGVIAKINGVSYFVGRPLDTNVYEPYYKLGKSAVEVRKEDEVIGYFLIEDKIREDSKKAVEKLKIRGIEPVLASGDKRESVENVAKTLGIEIFFAECKPHEKVDIIHRFQSKGGKVLMAGDGINDAAALKAADISISISNASDLAVETADILILMGGLSKLNSFIEISENTLKKIKENLFWAFLYNIFAIPLAMAGLLNPVIAEIAMALSSITVILNSLRLKAGGKYGSV
jgi:Cu+-exporting ATPase